MTPLHQQLANCANSSHSSVPEHCIKVCIQEKAARSMENRVWCEIFMKSQTFARAASYVTVTRVPIRRIDSTDPRASVDSKISSVAQNLSPHLPQTFPPNTQHKTQKHKTPNIAEHGINRKETIRREGITAQN